MAYATQAVIDFLEGSYAQATAGRGTFNDACAQAVSDLTPCSEEWPDVEGDIPATDEMLTKPENGAELGTGNQIRAQVAAILASLAKASE